MMDVTIKQQKRILLSKSKMPKRESHLKLTWTPSWTSHSTVNSHDRYCLHTDSNSEHNGYTELCKQSANVPSGATYIRAQFTAGTSTSASCSYNRTQRFGKSPVDRVSCTITTAFPTVIAPTSLSYPPTTPRSSSCETREGRPLRKLCSRRRNYSQ